MAKVKTSFVCGECGYESARWYGKCPQCGSWNAMSEVEIAPRQEEAKRNRHAGDGAAQAYLIGDIPEEAAQRLSSGIGELDRVLGGGAVEGAVILVGGDPGIGISTLLTQASANMARAGIPVLYASGEESARQIKLRARRLGAEAAGFYVLAENDMEAVLHAAQKLGARMLVIDSIQTMLLPGIASTPGSVTQVRETATALIRYAKQNGCGAFLVGHVTKEGSLAGPRVLEHMVDVVLYFEGDRQHQYRMLRAVKNRYGSSNELGMFEMAGDGMREVKNASEMLLSERAADASGSVVMCAMEGTRPMLTDVQALVTTTVFGNPRRMASGVDQGRLALLLAVLEKRAGFRLYDQDVYINIAGGMTLTEPAADLALVLAVASSRWNVSPGTDFAAMGEVGLAGEVRAIAHAQRRVDECVRLGFRRIVLPRANLRQIQAPEGAQIVGVSTVLEATALLKRTNRANAQEGE